MPQAMETVSLLPWCPASEHSGHLMTPGSGAPQGRVLTRNLLDRAAGKGRDWGTWRIAEVTGRAGQSLVREAASAPHPPARVWGLGQQSPWASEPGPRPWATLPGVPVLPSS